MLPDEFAELVSFTQESLVTSREGKRLEFKQSFSVADFSDYTKVLASFANAQGGCIVFGVSDKPRAIVGIEDPIDEAKWVDRLRDDLEPEIAFQIKQYVIGGARLYAIEVGPSTHKPVICKRNRSKVIEKKGEKKDVEIIREGAIYFRYAGQTKVIGYAELHNMLQEREQNYLKSVMETLQIIQRVGVENTGVVDMSGQRSSVYMSKETAKGLSFIDKGKVVEESGAPAYVVMGNVDLREVVHAPLEDADKNIPSEASAMLGPIAKDVYGIIEKIHASQVTLLLKHLKIDGDNIHSVVEKKMGRKYITRAGIAAIEDFMRKKPEDAIKVFGSKGKIAAYGLKKVKDGGGIEALFETADPVMVGPPAMQPAEASPSPPATEEA